MTSIDPGGDGDLGPPQNTQTIDEDGDYRGGGVRAEASEAGGEAPLSIEHEGMEELIVRRLSLQATGGGAEEPEGEETKTREEAGPANTEQEMDKDEGIYANSFENIRFILCFRCFSLV